MSRLLVMACSATKNPAAGAIRAFDRYTGPVWQTLKAVDPHGQLAHVTALSALHGWVDGDYLMADYDVRMSADRKAAVLAQQTFNAWVHPDVQTALMRATRAYSGPITEVCIVGGHLYQDAAQQLVAHARLFAPEHFEQDCTVTKICDQVGFMRQRLRAWLLAGAQQEAA